MTRDRTWELDFARGLAVFLMIAFHLVFDLSVYYNVNVNYMKGFWYYEGRISAILFMYISGISATYSQNPAKRGIVVFSWALLVTAISIPVMGENYIRFGILHFLGAVMILKGIVDFFVKERKTLNFICVVLMPVSVILGNIYAQTHTEIPFLFPIGIIRKEFTSYDYYPIFPWVTFFAAGVLTGGTVYKNKKSLTALRAYSPYNVTGRGCLLKPFCFLGRHSLIIYMAHQPVLIALLRVVFYFI